MSGTTTPTVTTHISKTEIVPLILSLGGAALTTEQEAAVTGGTLTVTDQSLVSSATLGTITTDQATAAGKPNLAGMPCAIFVGSAAGTTTATCSFTSGGATFSTPAMTLIIDPMPLADAVSFDVSDAFETASSTGTTASAT